MSEKPRMKAILPAGQIDSVRMWAFIALFSVTASLLLVATHASGAPTAFEAEQGTLAGTAASFTDTGASGNASVKFRGTTPTPTPTGSPAATVSSATPCVHAPAPAQWKHVVVLIFENKTYNSVIGTPSPWITSMAGKCGTYSAWKDANFKVNGTTDGNYVSKPNYATYTSGVSPTVHGLTNDTYTTTSNVDNIFNRLNLAGKTAKVYQSGGAASCATSNFSGAYHDPMRYYTNLGAQSATPTTYCNTHDVPIAQFMTDVTSGSLPAYSFILPTNSENMHDNTVATGDAWAQNFLVPLLDSAQYKSGDTAIFFLWDEDTPIPNVLMAPSIAPGSQPVLAAGNPISHFSALRTWQEMLGISPLLGDTGQAPSLLQFYNGN